jgi:hypothetical protein
VFRSQARGIYRDCVLRYPGTDNASAAFSYVSEVRILFSL